MTRVVLAYLLFAVATANPTVALARVVVVAWRRGRRESMALESDRYRG